MGYRYADGRDIAYYQQAFMLPNGLGQPPHQRFSERQEAIQGIRCGGDITGQRIALHHADIDQCFVVAKGTRERGLEQPFGSGGEDMK